MKVRIKFQKYGSMKFVGHLDVMRYFQKAFRRAMVDVGYSQGYSPHQQTSFAAPLGVGLTSDAEYMDADLLSYDAPEIMIERINAVLTEGFRVIGFTILKETEVGKKVMTAMSIVSAADYLVSLKDGYTLCDTITTQAEFKKTFEQFYSMSEIIIDKKTKKSEQSVNIKSMISWIAFDRSKELMANSVAEEYENGIKVTMQLATGSASNLKPELVMEAFCNYFEIPSEKYAWQVHRLEVYTREEETGKLFPLDKVEY